MRTRRELVQLPLQYLEKKGFSQDAYEAAKEEFIKSKDLFHREKERCSENAYEPHDTNFCKKNSKQSKIGIELSEIEQATNLPQWVVFTLAIGISFLCSMITLSCIFRAWCYQSSKKPKDTKLKDRKNFLSKLISMQLDTQTQEL